MLGKPENQALVVVDDLEVGAVHVAADPLLKRKNHHQHPMKILVMNQKPERDRLHREVEVHEAEAVNQKNQKNLNYPKRMTKSWQNRKATKARFVRRCNFFLTFPMNWIIFNNILCFFFVLLNVPLDNWYSNRSRQSEKRPQRIVRTIKVHHNVQNVLQLQQNHWKKKVAERTNLKTMSHCQRKPNHCHQRYINQ